MAAGDYRIGLDGKFYHGVADYYITNFSRSESNEEFITYSVTAEPTDGARDPAWDSVTP